MDKYAQKMAAAEASAVPAFASLWEQSSPEAPSESTSPMRSPSPEVDNPCGLTDTTQTPSTPLVEELRSPSPDIEEPFVSNIWGKEELKQHEEHLLHGGTASLSFSAADSAPRRRDHRPSTPSGSEAAHLRTVAASDNPPLSPSSPSFSSDSSLRMPLKGRARIPDESALITHDKTGRPSSGPRRRLDDGISEIRRHNSEPTLMIPRSLREQGRAVLSPTFSAGGSPLFRRGTALDGLSPGGREAERVNFLHSDLNTGRLHATRQPLLQRGSLSGLSALPKRGAGHPS